MGDIIVSVDAELAWGYHDRPTPPERIRSARDGWTDAVELFDRYDVPATWAVVGHLFLEECDGRHASHPLGPEWFDRDPGGSLEDYGLWYGRDLVETVAAADADHEIASHSFSHVEFGRSATGRETAVAEVTASLRAADRLGVSLDSFVFPWNRVGHRDVLAEYGFECYRGDKPAPSYHDSRFRPVAKLLDWYLGGESPPVVTPAVDEYGLVDVPASMYLFSFEGRPRALLEPVWSDPVVTVARRGVDRVSDGDGVFHVWLHPHNLLQPDGRERLAAILSYVDERRAEGDVTVRTMREVAADYRDRRPGREVVA